jgi:hypothetical protein
VGRKRAELSGGTESAAAVGGADVDELEEGVTVVVGREEEAVARVELERNEEDDVRRNERQACASILTAVRCGAQRESSSGSGSGSTVDLNRMRSHQLGTRCLLLESYTPLSSSSSSSSAVPSPMKDRLERTSDLSEAVPMRTPSVILSGDGAERSPRSGVVGTLRAVLMLALGWGVGALVRRERIRRGGEGAWSNSAHLDFARCAAEMEIRLTSPPLV